MEPTSASSLTGPAAQIYSNRVTRSLKDADTTTDRTFEVCTPNTQIQILAMLDDLHALPSTPPPFYILIQGSELVTLMVLPRSKIFSINIRKHRSWVFTVSSSQDVTLKAILESNVVPKVFFDVRLAARLLFEKHGIHLNCVHELQLMELATRVSDNDDDDDGKTYLAGLESVIHTEKPLPPAWTSTFADVIFDRRILIFPQLWIKYHQRLIERVDTTFWVFMIRSATRDRLLEARSAIPAKGTACGPWSEQTIKESRDIWKDRLTNQRKIFDHEWDLQHYRVL